MSIMQRVKQQIEGMPAGQLITYADFKLEEAEFGALAAALSRLARQGYIARYGKGHYYKPKETVFGSLKPREKDVVSSLVNRSKNKAAYEGGMSLYNRLGLTTQVPNELTIVTNASRKAVTRRSASLGKTKVKIIESSINFQETDIDKLEILDAIQQIKKIAASSVDEIGRILLTKLASYQPAEVVRVVELAESYNPSTRAFLGAMLDKLGYVEMTKPLRNNLNPLSNYRLGISERVLPNKKDWRII